MRCSFSQQFRVGFFASLLARARLCTRVKNAIRRLNASISFIDEIRNRFK